VLILLKRTENSNSTDEQPIKAKLKLQIQHRILNPCQLRQTDEKLLSETLIHANNKKRCEDIFLLEFRPPSRLVRVMLAMTVFVVRALPHRVSRSSSLTKAALKKSNSTTRQNSLVKI
jgi:hypothetical protein